MSNLLVAADMLEDMGNPLCETLREYADKLMKCGHDAFELQREVSEATGIDVSNDLWYSAFLFGTFGIIETSVPVRVSQRELTAASSRYSLQVVLIRGVPEFSVWLKNIQQPVIDEVNHRVSMDDLDESMRRAWNGAPLVWSDNRMTENR